MSSALAKPRGGGGLGGLKPPQDKEKNESKSKNEKITNENEKITNENEKNI